MDGFSERSEDRLAYIENAVTALWQATQKNGFCQETEFLTESERFNQCEDEIEGFLQQYSPQQCKRVGEEKAALGGGEENEMNIQEATAYAMKNNCCITRPRFKEFLKIKPTNTSECCMGMYEDGLPRPRWNPKAEDLMASDWECISG